VRGTLTPLKGLEALNAELDGAELAIAGHDMVTLRYEFAETLEEGDWRHIPVRYRLWATVSA
jgi:hypothetical protein